MLTPLSGMRSAESLRSSETRERLVLFEIQDLERKYGMTVL